MSFESSILAFGKKIKSGIETAGEDAVKVATFLEQNAVEITGLAGLAGSKSVSVTNTATSVLGKVIAAVEAAGESAGANGLSVSLDAETIAAVKAVIAAFKAL